MSEPIDRTRAWIEKVVVGLKLCPFAENPFTGGRIRFVLEETDDLSVLSAKLLEEAALLVKTPKDLVETTLIVHPNLLTNFRQYNDYQEDVEGMLRKAELEGVVQVATFHPDYQFAETKPDDPENYTNRSPYPMLHLLREESVEQAVKELENPEEIPERNIRVMKDLGPEGIRKLLDDV